MTKRTNLFPSLIKTREMNCLKIAGASLLLLCISPQFAVADGLKQDAVTIMQQQNLKVSGVVTDEAGEPLIGVSVLVKGTTLGNITDLNGRFSLDVPEGSILEISYIGYKTQSIKAQREPMNIVLKEDAQKLDEVVVVGFGTQKKVNLTGSVSAVTGDDISKRPVANAATRADSGTSCQSGTWTARWGRNLFSYPWPGDFLFRRVGSFDPDQWCTG